MKKELRKEIETLLFSLQHLDVNSDEYEAAISAISAYQRMELHSVVMRLSVADRAHVEQHLPPSFDIFRDDLLHYQLP